MRAVIVESPGGEAHVASIDAPVPVLSEALIDVHAASINPIDWKTIAGRGVFAAVPALPWVPGNDLAGRVVAAPYELADLQPGDAVFGMASFPRGPGTWAEQTTASTLQLARMPGNLSFAEAAAVPCAGLTAWDAVVRIAKAHRGQRILVHAGAGGVGHFAVQFAKYFGAWVAATSSESNLELLASLGVEQPIDYRAHRFEDVLQKVDVVIDLVGNVHDDTGSRSLDVLKPGGLYLNVPTASWPDYASAAGARGMRASHVKVEPDGANLAIIARLIEAGDVRVELSRTYPLEEVADALAQQRAGHTRGKLVLLTR